MSEIVRNEQESWRKITDTLLLIITVSMALFHMYTASFGVLPSYAQAAIHWGLIGTYIVLTRPLKFKGGIIIDILFIVLNIFLSYYQLVLQEKFILTAGVYSQFERYLSIASIVCAIAIAWRVLGKILPIISALFIGYALFGQYIPGVFKTVPFTLWRIAPYLYTSADGLYGQTLSVSAQFIFLFVMFGAILEITGAGEFFVDLAFSVTGRSRGGPAQAAVYSSMLMGTINGSGAANVVTTGTFTIPLMKRVGYKPSMAGAIEAVASSGGQIMPPVMGAVAFLMSEITGIEYSKIALSALIPALLYYATLSISVYLTARRDNIPVATGDQIKQLSVVFKQGWLYFTPLIVLVALLMIGYSAQKSAFYAILVSFVVGFIKNRENMTPGNIVKSLKGAVSGISSIAAACLLAGIIMGVINMTGLGLKISGIIQAASNGNLLIALILSMLTSLLLGMGLPTSAAYMILAILVAPAIVAMGVIPMAAHMFILYFGALSTITPPVALSTFAAAGIAGSGIWETGRDAMKLAAAGFIIPFVFAYNYELLMIGAVGDIIFAFVTALIGCAVLSMSLDGWGGVKLSIVTRLIMFVCSILLFLPKPLMANALGIVVTFTMLFIEYKLKARQNAVEAQQ